MTDLIRKVAEPTSSSSATPRSRRPYTCSQEWPPGTASEVIPGDPRANPPSGRPWPRIPQNIGYDPPLNAIAGRSSAPCDLRYRYNGSFGPTGANLAQLALWEGDGGPRVHQRGLPERLRLFVTQGDPPGPGNEPTSRPSAARTRRASCRADS